MDSNELGEGWNDKYSMKKMLFTRAIPRYVIPVPTAGYKVYACIDCGDKFILESSLQQHVERKSVRISYYCRHCDFVQVFYNRCNMLCHIRSHGFKTATINLTDLRLDPLLTVPSNQESFQQQVKSTVKKSNNGNNHKYCFDCGTQLSPKNKPADVRKTRSLHYLQGSETILRACPVCSYRLPTLCAFKAHLRLHLEILPFHCTDCGINLDALPLPYQHTCPSFNMMQAFSRLKCPITGCKPIHPREFKEHIRIHLRPVYKCSGCYLACFDEHVIKKHVRSSHKISKKKLVSTYFQCQLCPGKLIAQSQLGNHLNTHVGTAMKSYPCWSCDQYFTSIHDVIVHYAEQHDDQIRTIYNCVMKSDSKPKKVYRVVKKCEQCKRSFHYKCKYEDIDSLPNECPYQCTFSSDTTATPQNEEIICFVCKNRISQNWEQIKKHFSEHHKTIKCVDVKVNLSKINVEKYIKNKNKKAVKRINAKKTTKSKTENESETPNALNQSRNESSGDVEFSCIKCGLISVNKESLELHLRQSHSDPCMAYQCMECGECFVVKPSFSKHLLIKHNISNAEEYIFQKKCFNERALNKYQDEPASNEPLQENQCKICREQFRDSTEVEKHFRVHGMAFLMKNNRNNSP